MEFVENLWRGQKYRSRKTKKGRENFYYIAEHTNVTLNIVELCSAERKA